MQYVGELARQYEAGGGLSFRGFVERLRDEAEETRAAEAPILEEGSDGVRMMTVHKAKGLEFPVVVLADIGAELSRSHARRAGSTARARAARSAWPAGRRRSCASTRRTRSRATRPKASAWPTSPRRAPAICWSSAPSATPRRRRLGEPAERGDLSGDGSPARGRSATAWAERFGPDSMVDREDTIPLTSVRPGIHGFDGDEPYAVTWWDPGVLDLDRQPTFGLRREELIAKDAAPGVVDAGREAFATLAGGARGGGRAGAAARPTAS